MNNVVLMGRLVADPELKATNTGKEVTSFRIAVNKPYQKGQDREADFFDIVAWGKTAAFVCQYFQKGKPIIITGHLQTRQYEVSDGSKRKVVEIVAGNVDFVIGDKTGGNTGAYEAPQPAAAYSAPSAPAQSMGSLIDTPTLDDGDLPF